MPGLRELLDYHYSFFDRSRISPDPLEFLHRYSDPRDIELTGFLASVFAYGNVRQIIRTIDSLLAYLERSPYSSLGPGGKLRGSSEIKHRFYAPHDTDLLLKTISFILKEHGSLKELFFRGYRPSDKNLKSAISLFSKDFLSYAMAINRGELSPGFRFMLPDPENGSACKRMNLFLRWMVRKDELDFGLWSEIASDKLVIPVDVHVARICTELRLTHYTTVSWKMAEEITDNLRAFDPDDPVRYDFAICHIGMRKLDSLNNYPKLKKKS
ncbi:MAG: TIGR02757 family protein [Bacteroidota bacterium]